MYGILQFVWFIYVQSLATLIRVNIEIFADEFGNRTQIFFKEITGPYFLLNLFAPWIQPQMDYSYFANIDTVTKINDEMDESPDQ